MSNIFWFLFKILRIIFFSNKTTVTQKFLFFIWKIFAQSSLAKYCYMLHKKTIKIIHLHGKMRWMMALGKKVFFILIFGFDFMGFKNVSLKTLIPKFNERSVYEAKYHDQKNKLYLYSFWEFRTVHVSKCAYTVFNWKKKYNEQFTDAIDKLEINWQSSTQKKLIQNATD